MRFSKIGVLVRKCVSSFSSLSRLLLETIDELETRITVCCYFPVYATENRQARRYVADAILTTLSPARSTASMDQTNTYLAVVNDGCSGVENIISCSLAKVNDAVF